MRSLEHLFFLTTICLLLISCDPDPSGAAEQKGIPGDSTLTYIAYTPAGTELKLSRTSYHDRLYGFWLGQCIANWTGLVTEMDKIGDIGEIKTGKFYTRDDWGKPDQPSIWAEGVPSDLSDNIDFVFEDTTGIWGADDDTDIEYIYQSLLYNNRTSVLTGPQIQQGWLRHIKAEEENFLWVSNQAAFDLMREGKIPPETSDSTLNPHYNMIDAQLTTEIFGAFAPGRPDVALKMAHLPIRTSAREDAALIAEFYVILHSLAGVTNVEKPSKELIMAMADKAREHLPEGSTPAAMYDFVKGAYGSGIPWEDARDLVYQRYQVEQKDGYDITSQNLYCNGCFAAGINYAASLVSLFYGEGDIVETIKIAVLAGWDSDNPAATWGGMLGLMIGRQGVEEAFGMQFSDRFNIHRTRIGFPDDGIDTFDNMANTGVYIVDRVVQNEMGGGVDLNTDSWLVPDAITANQD